MPEHTCRILDFSLMDNIYFVSLRKYVISFIFVIYDISYADLIQCTVLFPGVSLTSLSLDTMIFRLVRS